MDAFRAEFACHRLSEDALRRLRWRKARKVGTPAKRGGIPGHQNCAALGSHRRRRETAGEIEEAHRVDLEVVVQHARLDLQERAPHAADRIVDEHAWLAERALDGVNRTGDLGRVGDVAQEALGFGHFTLQRCKPVIVTGKHRHSIAALREAPCQRGPGAWADAGYDANRLLL